jgi:RNA polymerase sigma factor (sigma-70 family)
MTMVAVPAQQPLPNHPLLQERARLESILDVMYVQTQKVMSPGGTPSTRRRARAGHGTERTVVGGTGPDDVLQDALLALLSFHPARLSTSWEALGVRIAQNKAKQALRTATKGRRRSGGRDAPAQEVSLVQLGAGGDGPGAADALASASEPESEFVQARQQLILMRLARELLDDRDRRIFFDVHYLDIPRAEVGRNLGLTGQRVGQIYRRAAERLLEAARNDPTFRTISTLTERGTP